MSSPIAVEREEGDSLNSERTACQVFPAAPSACQRSVGVVSVAKLCHVCMKTNPYVCQAETRAL